MVDVVKMGREIMEEIEVPAVIEQLKMRRKQLGWTQKDLEYWSGVDQATISGTEAGKHSPRMTTLMRLADAMDLEIVARPRRKR